jgi:hypothetical protein
MGGSFSLVLSSSCSAAVHSDQREPAPLIAKGDNIYVPASVMKDRGASQKDFPERLTFKEE